MLGRRRNPLPALIPALMLASPTSLSGQDSTAIAVDAAYTADLISNVRGGVRSGAAVVGNFDLTATLDLGELADWEGTRVFVYALGTHGGQPSSFTGDSQVLSNIQAPSGVRLYEAWIEKDFRDAGLSILVGLYDLNSEFDVLPGASLFLNSSFGIGAEFAASGVNGPSIFPVTSLAIRGTWRPSSFIIRAAVLDGVPGDPSDPGATAIRLSRREGVLMAFEAGWVVRRSRGGDVDGGREEGRPARRTHGPVGRRADADEATAKVAIGIWNYSRRARAVDPDLGDARIAGRPGIYLLGEWSPISEGPDGGGRLTLSGRAGVADARTNRYAAYTGLSTTYRGLLPGRPTDEVGLGVAAAHDGAEFREARRAAGRPAGRTETAVELTYRFQGDGWALQPDIQYVIQPDADPTIPNALAVGMRGELSLF